MIMAEAGSYSVTRNSSHFKELRPSDDEEDEPRSSAGRKTTSADAGRSGESAASTVDDHHQAENTSEEIGQERGSSHPMQVSRKPKRLIEEL
ncbi:hypothetical protein NDU88_007494 [Pleurodeles waltl]|uniref:Uncharacterized protein n=1 Tax=Pleurodeles waltl TaxID=8319 RepID=A0AAV7SSN7_PLEWA|nr:hypothetical protein NDU88_007494 [Pleurodeles waltl]